MPARHKLLRLRYLALGAAAAVTLAPYAADSGTCSDAAARNLLTASYVDTALNVSAMEDLEFLYSEGGFPNIMVLFDSSMSMQMLAPDGPGKIGDPDAAAAAQKVDPTAPPHLPPGFPISNRTSAVEQAAAMAATASSAPNPRIVGCGLDEVSAKTPEWIGSQTIRGLMARRFFPPCGNATDPGLVGATYQGDGVDYASAMKVCPYFTSSDNQAVGAPGYDPDFYPTFFPKDLVFHDNALHGAYTFNSTTSFRGNFGDGWTDDATYPFLRATKSPGSISDFCALQGATLQGTRSLEDICNECLAKAGWYYDGIILDPGDNTYARKHPSLWYTGNYLSFFPPKFLAARKIMKDVVAVQSRIRMALSRFDSSGATVFQPFNPSCGMPEGSNFDSNRASYVSSLNSSTNLPFSGSTPLAQALFDLGRYYHSPDLPWFGPSWENATKESASNANQSAVCFSCQTSTVIVLTDGVPSGGDGTTLPKDPTTQAQADGDFYAGDAKTGIQGITGPVTDPTTPGACKECESFSGAEDYLNNLPRVAWYLRNMDLRKNAETTLDCKGMGGKQGITTYTLGFATGQLPNANTILRNTAAAGGGIFVGAEDPSALKQGINYILQEISTRATSFSVATISTLQTTSGRSVIVPRFSPSKQALWQGNLYRYDLYSEFVNKCEPNGAGDLDCDGQCASTFLQDNSGSDDVLSFISEDGNGAFVRNEPRGAPICDQAPLCAAAGKSCAVPGSASAVEFWDAGKELAKRSWDARNVFTVVDDNGDGRIDQADKVFELLPTDTVADRVIPYLALGTSPTGTSVCSELSSLLATAGDLTMAGSVIPPATPTAAEIQAAKRECAKTIIRYVLGADIFNEAGKSAPDWPVADPDKLWDRAFKLGDIYHSSPVEVMPPLPRDGVLCPNGYHNQCMWSLWGTPTPNGEQGYDDYSKSTTYVNRDKIVLVGANDGLLHAFQGGTWRANKDDGYTSAVNEGLPPFNGYYDRGTAAEIWAFAPPDMLAKLPLLLGSRHQFYVDGTPMVRDVWVDGSKNGLGLASSKNGAKEGSEFHTVAVVGERRGGTRFFALDVTDATDSGSTPRFLWIYPQPNDPESLTFGETYNDFLPTPPPIGPVRIRAGLMDPSNSNTQEVTVPGEASPVKYHERWVALLPGGFDQQYVRGRGVHMVDVWTGDEVFDFSYPLDPAVAPAGDPRLNLRYPVPAVPGMMAWGSKGLQDNFADHEGFFDTATFGDAGGQLWTLRFFAPGTRGTDGRVTDWYGARAFQMGGQTACKLCGNQPIFTITANAPIGVPAIYRTYFGTGDRFNLLDKNGGTCGPDNIRACVMRGCTVTLDVNSNFLDSYGVGFAKRGMSQAACNAMANSQSDGSAIATCTSDGRAKIVISACPDGSATTKDVAVTCTDEDDGYRCRYVSDVPGDRLAMDITKYPVNVGNWFLSLRVFEDGGPRDVFWNLAEAKAYDSARLWVAQTGIAAWSAAAGLVVRAASDDTFGAGATESSPGWAVRYDHGPTATIDYHQYNVAWQDERTTTQAAIGAGVLTWHSTQPSQGEVTSTSGGCRASKCTAQNRRVSYHYGADPVSGRPVLTDPVTGNLVRAVKSYLLVPNQADQRTIFVNQEGQVAIGLTAVNPEKGATNVGMSDPEDPTSDAGYLEIDEQLHRCRHADGTTVQPDCK